MKKPRRLESYPAQSYPGIHRYRCERREFLRKVALGAVSVGVGSRLLAACSSTQGIQGHVVGEELRTVTLPSEGTAGLYLNDWSGSYLTYRITVSTYSGAMAEHLVAQESLALAAANPVLAPRGCTDLRAPDVVGTIEEELGVALLHHYREMTGDEEAEIHSLSLQVVSCEGTDMPDGGMDMPDYP